MNVAILGASRNPDRYAYLAFELLKEKGHRPFPVNPGFSEIEGVPCVAKLSEIQEPIDTLTMYVGPERSTPLLEEIRALKPRRIIFNPGSENPELMSALEKDGIEIVEGCTLVMLRTKQF